MMAVWYPAAGSISGKDGWLASNFCPGCSSVVIPLMWLYVPVSRVARAGEQFVVQKALSNRMPSVARRSTAGVLLMTLPYALMAGIAWSSVMKKTMLGRLPGFVVTARSTPLCSSAFGEAGAGPAPGANAGHERRSIRVQLLREKAWIRLWVPCGPGRRQERPVPHGLREAEHRGPGTT